VNVGAINETLRTIAELINNLAAIALKLIIIGVIIVIEQWLQHY